MKTMLNILILSITILALLGCDNSGVSPDDNLLDGNISLSMGVPPASLNRASISSQAVAVSQIRLLLEEVELIADIGDSADFKIGPLVVDLNLAGGVSEIGVGSIPPGSYDKFKFKVKKVHTDDVDTSDTQFTDFIGTETSMIIEGYYNSESFTLRIEEEFEQEIEFLFPIDVLSDTSLSNLTLLVDIETWFVDFGTSNDLDPRESSNLSKIIENIDRSFKAYEDDDEDGEMEFEGVVAGVDVENGSFTLESSGFSISANASTTFEGLIMSLDSVQTLVSTGSPVRVNGSGSQQSGQSILATELEFVFDD